MNKPFLNQEGYPSGYLQLGEMIHTRQPAEAIRERFAALCGEESAQSQAPFDTLREVLSLEPPEAMCVALWMYLDTSPLPALTASHLLEHCRRLGGRSPEQSLAKLFVASGETVALHPIAADFLLQRQPRLPGGVELVLPDEAPMLHAHALFDELDRLLRRYIQGEPFPLLIALCGEEGSGRRFLVSKLGGQIGCCVLRVDPQRRPELADIALAASLYGAVVCIENAQDAKQAAEVIDRVGFAFAVCDADDGYAPEECNFTVLRRELPPPGSGNRAAILREFLKDVPLAWDVEPGRELGLKRLSVGKLKAFSRELKAESMAAGKAVDRQLFRRVLHRYGGARVWGAARMEGPGRLGDLVLPEELMRQLTELCAFAAKRDRIYGDWGFGKKITWGRGISALFYGAPGTGKTLAANLLANEIGLSLMRVDISQLMSKYIGETQKNIGRVFDEALKSDCVLFFDEADALFTRRSEAADAQDKYANAETAYLLQRMEQYDGICILATNLLQNFDEAFRRRIGYMLHFQLPGEALREKIWRSIFPADAPVEKLDYGLLAQQLELSGASIKNCAVHAAYLAAMHDTAITMRYILAGARNEYAKQGKALSPQAAQMLSI